jgi:hypothetical protein
MQTRLWRYNRGLNPPDIHTPPEATWSGFSALELIAKYGDRLRAIFLISRGLMFGDARLRRLNKQSSRPRFACLDDDEQFRIWCVVFDQSAICSRSSARMVIRILFVSWAVFLLASQLICGCATFLHWLSAG